MEDIIYKELLNIADKKGIEIIDNILSVGSLEGLYMQYEDIEVISLNINLKNNQKRKNFILAHELGHHSLHKGKIDPRHIYNKGTAEHEKIEEEANNYANDLIEELTQRVGKQAIV